MLYSYKKALSSLRSSTAADSANPFSTPQACRFVTADSVMVVGVLIRAALFKSMGGGTFATPR